MSLRKKQRGIGLLELMLSLSIIAILLVMATRYYDSARHSNRMNDAISQVNAIAAATYNYKNSNITGDYSNVSIKTLVAENWLPPSFGTPNADPWGGVLGVFSTGSNFSVTLSNIPSTTVGSGLSTCNALANIINNNTNPVNGSSGNATCSGSTLTVTFN